MGISTDGRHLNTDLWSCLWNLSVVVNIKCLIKDGLCEPYNSIEKINIRKIGVPDGEEKKL